MADAVCLTDPAGNPKLAKGRALGRIDPAAAAVLAVAEGQRMITRPVQTGKEGFGHDGKARWTEKHNFTGAP